LCISLGHFFSGGEYYSSIIFSLEHAKTEKRGTFSGLSCVASVIGLLLSSGLSSWAGTSGFEVLSWRLLFALGFVGGVASYLLKYHCRETPAFQSVTLVKRQFESLGSFIKRRWPQILSIAVVAGFFGSIYAFIFYFIANQSPTLQSTTHAVLGMVFYGICLLMFGILSEKISARRMMIAGGIGFITCAALLLNNRDPESLVVAKYALIFFVSMIIGPLHAWMLDRFIPAERCRGLICGFGLGSALAYGSTTPSCLYLYSLGYTFFEAGVYPLSLTALTILIVFKSKAAAQHE
jgi:MHS family proline/betaine transporter-like MFS transporter